MPPWKVKGKLFRAFALAASGDARDPDPDPADTFWETPWSGNRLLRITTAARLSGILGRRSDMGEPRNGSLAEEVLSWKTEPRSDGGG